MYGGNRGGCHGGGRGGPGGGWGGPGGGRGGPGGGWGGPGGGRGGPGGGCGGRGGPGGGPGGGRGGPWGGPGCGPGGGRGGPWGGPGGGPWGGPRGGPWGGPRGPWNGPGGGPWNGPGGNDGCTTTPPPTTPAPTPPAPTPPPPTPPAPTPVKKLEAQGGETGAVWDDGHHDDVKKVYVGQGIDGISAVKFEYIKGSQVVFGDEHGKPTGLGYEDFELEAGEYITSVEGTYDKVYGHDSAILTMLLFKTNLNKTKGPFGMETQSRFEFKEEGHKITGFHGRAAGDVVHAIGAYFTPIGTTPLKPATPT